MPIARCHPHDPPTAGEDRDDMSETEVECGKSPEHWPQLVCDKPRRHAGDHRHRCGEHTWPPAGDPGGERGGAGDDTLPQWLCQRFGGGEPWATQSADDQAYWEHEAAATRRAVARNGFRAPAPAGDSGGERCANYKPPVTCLTAPSSEAGRCDFCRVEAADFARSPR